jgi:alkylated DNA repair dioxygenase AlkB
MDHQPQLSLSGDEETPPHNVLPRDGEAIYHGTIFDPPEADSFLQTLLETIPWKSDEVVLFGKHIVTARKVAWYGDRHFDYSYSGSTRTARLWTPELRKIKATVEQHAGIRYNSCLLNLYAEGTQGMGWHSDDEKELDPDSNIASVSFGAERRFDFRHKESHQKVSVILAHGSLLIMRGATQTHWQHQIPKTTKVTSPRVNLTFRRIVETE